MFIAALFTIAKLWKQSRCPTTEKWLRKCCIHNDVLFIIKEELNYVIFRKADGTGEHHVN
jgi:hypothetical protein